jgi:hypothetical protein
VICFLLGLLVVLAGVLVCALVGWPMYRLFKGYWPDSWADLVHLCSNGLVACIALPALLIAIYTLGCMLRGVRP